MDGSDMQPAAKVARTSTSPGSEQMAELAVSPLMTSMASPMPSPLPTIEDQTVLEVRIKGALQRDGAFNGVVCTLLKFDEKLGRWSVHLPAVHGGQRKLIQSKHLELLFPTYITQSGDANATALHANPHGLTVELLNAESVPVQKWALCKALTHAWPSCSTILMALSLQSPLPTLSLPCWKTAMSMCWRYSSRNAA